MKIQKLAGVFLKFKKLAKTAELRPFGGNFRKNQGYMNRSRAFPAWQAGRIYMLWPFGKLFHKYQLFRRGECICFHYAEIDSAWETSCIPRQAVISGFIDLICQLRYKFPKTIINCQ